MDDESNDVPSPNRRRKRRVIWRSLATLGLAVTLGGVGYVVWTDRRSRQIALPPTVGNFEGVRQRLGSFPADGHYQFAVVGDTRGMGTYENIMEMLKGEPLAFLVNLGDFVTDPVEEEHRFFALEMATEMVTPYPVFLVVGNHDIGKEGFVLSDFEEHYGPSQFAFRYGPDLFVVLRWVRGWPTRPAEVFLEDVLERERAAARHVFVFTHTPLPLSPHVAKVGAGDPTRLVELLERFRVTYLLAGDLHGYRRIERNGVCYFVTGGGGAHLAKRSRYGRFYHAVVMDVGPEGTEERILRVPKGWGVGDRLELWAISRAAPWLGRFWYLAALGACAWLVLIVLAWRSFARARSVPGGEPRRSRALLSSSP